MPADKESVGGWVRDRPAHPSLIFCVGRHSKGGCRIKDSLAQLYARLDGWGEKLSKKEIRIPVDL